MTEKKILRSKYINLRSSFSYQYINNVSEAVCYKLFNLDVYKNCKNIFLYLSMEKELNTKYIINKAKKDKKQIFAPVLTDKKGIMTFKKYNEKNLIKNKFNILEPINEEEKISDNNTLIIVPAIIYNKNKYRIGYGGGYYDKYLKENIYLCSVGICFDNFVIDFKEDNYDKNVNIVITEKNIY